MVAAMRTSKKKEALWPFFRRLNLLSDLTWFTFAASQCRTGIVVGKRGVAGHGGRANATYAAGVCSHLRHAQLPLRRYERTRVRR